MAEVRRSPQPTHLPRRTLTLPSTLRRLPTRTPPVPCRLPRPAAGGQPAVRLCAAEQRSVAGAARLRAKSACLSPCTQGRVCGLAPRSEQRRGVGVFRRPAQRSADGCPPAAGRAPMVEVHTRDKGSHSHDKQEEAPNPPIFSTLSQPHRNPSSLPLTGAPP